MTTESTTVSAPVTDAPVTQEPVVAHTTEGTTEDAQSNSNTQSDSIWPSQNEPAKTNEQENKAPAELPEWFMKDKYSSIEDQAKAQYDMQKLMGKNWGAPKDDYQLSVDGVKADDPMLVRIKPILKEMGISQEGFNNLIKNFSDAQNAIALATREKLMKEVVEREPENFKAVDKWLTNSFAKEDADTIRSWIVTPEDYQVINKLKAFFPASTNVPSMSDQNVRHYESSIEVTNEKVKYKTELAEGKRSKDANYENELRQRFRDARQRELVSKK